MECIIETRAKEYLCIHFRYHQAVTERHDQIVLVSRMMMSCLALSAGTSVGTLYIPAISRLGTV